MDGVFEDFLSDIGRITVHELVHHSVPSIDEKIAELIEKLLWFFPDLRWYPYNVITLDKCYFLILC